MATMQLQDKAQTAPAAPAAPERKAPGKYIISSDSEDGDIFVSRPLAAGGRGSAQGPQKKVSPTLLPG